MSFTLTPFLKVDIYSLRFEKNKSEREVMSSRESA